jgi:hypothetical protein
MGISMLTQNQIADEFKKQVDGFRDSFQEVGLTQAIQNLSRAVCDLKNAGIDVSLDMVGHAGEMVFNMFHHGSGQLRVPVAGMLRIGNVEKLVGIAVHERSQPCLKLAVSELNFAFQGAESDVRATTYDLRSDPEAWDKLQKDIIYIAARASFIQECDVAEAFVSDNSLRKRSHKMSIG